jgi:cholesterol oxidase
LNRRTFLKTAAGAAAAGPAALGATNANAAPSTNPLQELNYRLQVPEIFRTLPDPPAHTPVVIIGSGFGGAVAAWRLAQAGVRSTVLERGSRWPIPSPWRSFFANDSFPDGRAFWRQTSFLGVNGTRLATDWFGGVLDVVKFDGLDVWRAAAVGGGSVVYTGAHPIPQRTHFEHLFGDTVDYSDMLTRWYPRAASVLGSSTMPQDIYRSGPYSHSRAWNAMVTRAGYAPVELPSVWDWDIVRRELNLGVRASSTVAESNYGNANGVKRGLQMNYLAYAEASGQSKIYPGHEVLEIGEDSSGRYLISVQKVSPTGKVLSRRTISCDRLILAAGSIGTTELLMRARQRGTLSNLGEEIGTGWGSNGDATTAWWWNPTGGLTQGAAPSTMITDVIDGLPVTLENWYVPGFPADLGIIGSLAMSLDDQRADFGIDAAGHLTLRWPGQQVTKAAVDAVNVKIASASRGAGGR